MKKSNKVKDNIAIGLSCFIDNPSFDSQSKKNLSTKPCKFYTNFNKTFDIQYKKMKYQTWIGSSLNMCV